MSDETDADVKFYATQALENLRKNVEVKAF